MILTEFVSMFVSLPHSRAGLAPGSVGSVSWMFSGNQEE